MANYLYGLREKWDQSISFQNQHFLSIHVPYVHGFSSPKYKQVPGSLFLDLFRCFICGFVAILEIMKMKWKPDPDQILSFLILSQPLTKEIFIPRNKPKFSSINL